LDAVFALDWYTETGQRLLEEIIPRENYSVGEQAMQLLSSGPGYLTIPKSPTINRSCDVLMIGGRSQSWRDQ
jgi:hypothetical protein